jgi:Type II secretory pathway, ATPase PulE/Tfp pilus assembly pathway, ATPase PilB
VTGNPLDPGEILSLIPETLSLDTLRSAGVLPLRREENGLVLGVSSLEAYGNAQLLSRGFEGRARIEVTDPVLLNGLFDRLYSLRSRIASDDVEAIEGVADLDAVAREDIQSDSVSAPVIRLVNSLFFEAVKERATDIHVEPFEDRCEVRFRVDGVLHDKLLLPKTHQAPLTTRIKVMARMDISERFSPQDGRIGISVGGRSVDIRVGAVPTQHGERLALRLLDKKEGLLTLEQLGMPGKSRAALEEMVAKPYGMVLLTGPTGSGKTTSLYAILQKLARPEVNVITVEDPIEYDLPGVGQIQVNEKAGVTFASALRAILRQDPDIIMVGEMRDFETAHMGVQASLTGHLVLSTLHTQRCPQRGRPARGHGGGTVPRGRPLLGVVAQRLVRKVCPSCSAETEAPPALRKLGIETVQKGTGCERCMGTGYFGRTGLYELLVMDDALREAVSGGASSSRIREEARGKGFKSLWELGLKRVRQGLTTPEELYRAVGEA